MILNNLLRGVRKRFFLGTQIYSDDIRSVGVFRKLGARVRVVVLVVVVVAVYLINSLSEQPVICLPFVVCARLLLAGGSKNQDRVRICV